MTDEELESPRVNAIVEKVLGLHRSSPTEKIIVGSASMKFLNIVNEVLTRKAALEYPNLFVYEFNGSIKSVEDRTNIADSFNLPVNEGGPTVLLLSAACGGSHLIIAESFWQPGLRTQLIGSAHRMPQAKEVYVYDVQIQTSD
jgi:SNF2 family DNA or RNA helicase